MKWVITFAVLFLAACSQVPAQDIPSEKFCEVDTDCVADSCCHADGAVNKENAPECIGVLCSLSCEPNTLDCGQGSVRCVENECVAVI
jgi:hypothetical protein